MSIKDAEVVEIDSILDSDKNNLKQIACLKCSSKILPPGKGAYEETDPFELHVMHKKLEEEGVEKEKIKQVNPFLFQKWIVVTGIHF